MNILCAHQFWCQNAILCVYVCVLTRVYINLCGRAGVRARVVMVGRRPCTCATAAGLSEKDIYVYIYVYIQEGVKPDESLRTDNCVRRVPPPSTPARHPSSPAHLWHGRSR